jgi:hypothetical protein
VSLDAHCYGDHLTSFSYSVVTVSSIIKKKKRKKRRNKLGNEVVDTVLPLVKHI